MRVSYFEVSLAKENDELYELDLKINAAMEIYVKLGQLEEGTKVVPYMRASDFQLLDQARAATEIAAGLFAAIILSPLTLLHASYLHALYNNSNNTTDSSSTASVSLVSLVKETWAREALWGFFHCAVPLALHGAAAPYALRAFLPSSRLWDGLLVAASFSLFPLSNAILARSVQSSSSLPALPRSLVPFALPSLSQCATALRSPLRTSCLYVLRATLTQSLFSLLPLMGPLPVPPTLVALVAALLFAPMHNLEVHLAVNVPQASLWAAMRDLRARRLMWTGAVPLTLLDVLSSAMRVVLRERGSRGLLHAFLERRARALAKPEGTSDAQVVRTLRLQAIAAATLLLGSTACFCAHVAYRSA